MKHLKRFLVGLVAAPFAILFWAVVGLICIIGIVAGICLIPIIIPCILIYELGEKILSE